MTLTVTDDDGATDVATDQITVTAPPPANQPPTASFTSSATGLLGTFNGAGSTDPDGTITAFAWDFGDGATGTGVNTTHTYAAAGTFTVTLKVTDNGGATAESAQPITVTAAPTNYAADTFSRTSTSGFGTANTGGAWTVSGGPATDYTVSNGAGRLRLPAAAAQRAAYLNGVSQTDTELNFATSADKIANGGGVYVTGVGRRVGTAGDYRTNLRIMSSGVVTLNVSRVVGGTETTMATTTLAGLTYTPGDVIRVRLQVGGTGPTTVRAKAWLAATTEPAAWQVTANDTTAALQAPGSVGVVGYLSGSSTNPPIVITIDDVTAGPRQNPN